MNKMALTDYQKDELRHEKKLGDLEYVEDTEKMTDQRRWVTRMERVYRDVKTGKFWRFSWDQPSTENQEYEFDSADMMEVQPITVSTIVYEVVK